MPQNYTIIPTFANNRHKFSFSSIFFRKIFILFLQMSKFFCIFAAAMVSSMNDNLAIQLFEGKRVRIVWDAEQEKYYFSVVDIVQVLTDSADYQTARKYWKVLKGRLIKEGNETVTNCYQLKLPAADGKKRMTDMADL